MDKATGAVSVLRLPSKRQALHLAEDSLIFRSDSPHPPYCSPYPCPYCTLTPSNPSRSDSNGEDLEGFAGAGAPRPAPLVLSGHAASHTPY